uniref:Disease resistance protein Roq1-like winged-helix domain-containing protein n=1 Tax=Physcomitrium patens TaxID=3218 RepID=A0A2K1IQM3_PHYPA|nr:hypothetical protein PHYPA_025697 [Physcomitrium patens]
MDGISKTTIAKATLTSVKDIYNASCFVECIESGGDCYTTCNILEQFKVKSKLKDVKEAQKMLKSFLKENKTILVFDNVKNQSQIEDVVPMDDLFSCNGSTLIATPRYFGEEVCKIDIEELDEEISKKLFIKHSCGRKNLSIKLIEVGKQIIRACSGLPLSLKVMGAFLRENKRLRYWERALQKLKRGRELDGDKNNNVELILNTLINQSLIKVDEDGIIRVHDQLQDMGRNIVENKMEYKYTRMWNLKIKKYSNLTSLPNELDNLISLTTLNISECSSLTSMPNELGNLTSLTTFKIKMDSSLRSLPNKLGSLTSLTIFDRSWCRSLTTLPNKLVNLIPLTMLNISKCLSLISLPNELGNLSTLTTLNISECSCLTSLPNELDNLSSLTTLIK